jgi:hypothetical protein
MFMNAVNRTLQLTYPVMILLVALASVGMNLVQAGGPDFKHVFPSRGGPQISRTFVAPDLSDCSVSDRFRLTHHNINNLN